MAVDGFAEHVLRLCGNDAPTGEEIGGMAAVIDAQAGLIRAVDPGGIAERAAYDAAVSAMMTEAGATEAAMRHALRMRVSHDLAREVSLG